MPIADSSKKLISRKLLQATKEKNQKKKSETDQNWLALLNIEQLRKQVSHFTKYTR